MTIKKCLFKMNEIVNILNTYIPNWLEFTIFMLTILD